MTAIPNRWRIPIGAVLVHVCIGSVYAWSTFNRPIQALFPDAFNVDTWNLAADRKSVV